EGLPGRGQRAESHPVRAGDRDRAGGRRPLGGTDGPGASRNATGRRSGRRRSARSTAVPLEDRTIAMRPEARRLLRGLLGLAASWAGMGLLGWFANGWPETPVHLAVFVTVLSVLAAAMFVSLGYAASGLVRLMPRGKNSSGGQS